MSGGRVGPLVKVVGAEEIDCGSADGDGDGSVKFEEAAASFCLGAARIEKHEGEARHGGDGWERVEGNAEGAREIGAANAEQDDADLLQRELKKNAGDDEHGDDLGEREETEECADEAEGDERAVGDAVLRVDGGEKAEVVAVAGGGVGNAGVAEEQREDAGEGGPDDEGGDQVAGPVAEG